MSPAAADRVPQALGRAAVYGVLALAFDYPTRERLVHLGARATAARGARASTAVRDGLGRLATAAGQADAEAVIAEHATLLDGPVRCPPYEGAWGPQQMSGKSAQLADVAGFYAAFGLAPTAWNAELEDHVAAECEFMAALALREAYAIAADRPEAAAVTRRAAATFMTDHLGRWAGAFATEVGRQASAPIYKEAAALLAAWVHADAEHLGATPTRVEGMAPAETEPLSCPHAAAETAG